MGKGRERNCKSGLCASICELSDPTSRFARSIPIDRFTLTEPLRRTLSCGIRLELRLDLLSLICVHVLQIHSILFLFNMIRVAFAARSATTTIIYRLSTAFPLSFTLAAMLPLCYRINSGQEFKEKYSVTNHCLILSRHPSPLF